MKVYKQDMLRGIFDYHYFSCSIHSDIYIISGAIPEDTSTEQRRNENMVSIYRETGYLWSIYQSGGIGEHIKDSNCFANNYMVAFMCQGNHSCDFPIRTHIGCKANRHQGC